MTLAAPSRFLCLTVAGALEPEMVRLWFHTVRHYAPDGVLTTTPVISPDGAPRPVSLIHRRDQDTHHYIVPLNRDLIETEAASVVEAFAAVAPDLDFDVRATIPAISEQRKPATLEVDDNRYLDLCRSLAKHQHQRWVSERTAAGWRYGPGLSVKNKTHPLMRPWDDLPDRHKIVDHTSPQMLLDFLNEQGFVVITKDELDNLLAQRRS